MNEPANAATCRGWICFLTYKWMWNRICWSLLMVNKCCHSFKKKDQWYTISSSKWMNFYKCDCSLMNECISSEAQWTPFLPPALWNHTNFQKKLRLNTWKNFIRIFNSVRGSIETEISSWQWQKVIFSFAVQTHFFHSTLQRVMVCVRVRMFVSGHDRYPYTFH